VTEAEKPTDIIISPSRWALTLISVVPAALSLLPIVFAHMDASGWGAWLGLSVLFLLFGLAGTRSRYELRGTKLGRRDLVRFRYMDLQDLADVRAWRPRNAYGWELRFTDNNASRIPVQLLGYRATDRRRLLDAVSRYVEDPDVQKEGPVAQLLTNNSWWPR
jgi:hypothetical protein